MGYARHVHARAKIGIQTIQHVLCHRHAQAVTSLWMTYGNRHAVLQGRSVHYRRVFLLEGRCDQDAGDRRSPMDHRNTDAPGLLAAMKARVPSIGSTTNSVSQSRRESSSSVSSDSQP